METQLQNSIQLTLDLFLKVNLFCLLVQIVLLLEKKSQYKSPLMILTET